MCQGRHCPTVPLSLVKHTHSSYGVTTKMEVQPFPAQWSFWVPPCLWRSVVGLSPRWPNFDTRSVHMRFIVDKVALWQVFLPALLFSPVSIIPPILHTHLHLICCPYQDKRVKPGNLSKKKQFSLINLGALTGYRCTYFHIAFKRLTLSTHWIQKYILSHSL